MTEQGHQPRVVVQLANGQEVPTSPGGGQYMHGDEDRIDAVGQLASMSNVDFEEAGMDDLAMSSPPPCGESSAQHMIVSPAGQLGDDDVDVTGDRHALPHSGGQGRRQAGSSGGRGASVHPPTSPSPPPSMTPPDHYGGHVVHHQKGPRRAQVVTTPGGTAVQQQQQQPPTPGMVADHCYGLPYQDHNYGGATAGAGGAAATGNGSASSSSSVRLSSGSQPPVRTTGMRTSRSSMSEENQEPFPIIGGLASYLGEDDSDDQGGLGSTATSTPLLAGSSRTLGGRSVGGDSLSISAYHRGGSVREQGPGVPYYQRYVSSHHADSATFGHQYASPSYSQSLVTIGGRTYIRQVAAPTSTVGGYRSAGRDFLGISSPNQSIYNISGSPYGAARRVVPGGVTGVTTFKRAGRPRTRGGVQTHTTLVPALPHGSMLGDGSPAPIIAPSRGGRPSGRGRAARTDVSSSDSGGGQTGARRARGAPAGAAAAAATTPTSPQMSLTQRRETKNAAAVLAEENRKAEEAEELSVERLANTASKQEIVDEVHKKYKKLLETPLPTAKQRKTGKATSLSPSKQLIDVENDRPDRTPSPITSVIMAARADAERRKSRDAADMVVESIVRSPIRGPPAAQTANSRKRQASPDFSLFEDPCVKEERDRDRAQAEAAAREQARKLMAASPLVGIPTSPGPVVRSPVNHGHHQDVYPRPVDFIKVDDVATTPQAAEDAADDTSDASSSSDEEETAESWESSSSGSDVDNQWSGDYVTRCLCGMQHNDEFMISCDQCEVWQHCRCMGIDTKRVPDNYLCEKCKPRPLKLTPAQAKELQAKKLAKWAKDKERRKQQRAKRHEQRAKEREKRKLMRKSTKKGMVVGKQTNDDYSEISENDYTSDAKRFVQMQGDSSGQAMLEQLSEQLCQVMYVAPGVQGLVSVHLVPPNQPVAEYRGRVCLKAECNGRDKAGRIQPHCLLYSGFTTGSSSTDAALCVDARQKGSAARFARRSCRPNTQVKHVISNEKLHLLLISTELIERGTEVTIPFDYDFRSSKFPLECACGATAEKEGEIEEEDVCPINELNRNLKVKKAQIVRGRTQVRKEKQKQMADAKAADQSRRAKEAQLRKAANKNSTAVKRAAQKVKAKLAVKSRKAKSKQQAAVAAAAAKRRVGGLKLKSKRLSSRTTSTGSAKDEKPAADEKGKTPQKQRTPAASPPPPTKRGSVSMKRTTSRTRTRSSATDSGSDARSPKPALPAKKEEPLEPMDYTLPEDRNKPVSREERKLQMAVAQIAKLEENAKRKAENKQRRMSGDQAATPPSSSSNRKALTSPLRRGRLTKKPNVVHRRKGTNKWKRGQTSKMKVKGTPKAKRKAGTPTTSPAKRGSNDEAETISSDEEESDVTSAEEEKSTGGHVATVDSSASRAPPRKRWASSTLQSPGSPPSVGVSTRSGGSPAVSGVSTLSPAGGGKKRWLRQARSEENVGEEFSSPSKKRRPGVDSPVIIPTEPLDREHIDSITSAEAAQLLTQMAADPQTPASPPPAGQQFPSPTRLIPTVAVDFGGIVAPTVIPPASGDRVALLSSGSYDGSEPQPAKRERRKVTLDEYKKRKVPPRDAKKSGDEGAKESEMDAATPSVSSSRPSTSFIPTLSEAELLESGRSHRLSSLPDPNQIGKSTVSVDDLKRRIYGKQFASALPTPSPTSQESAQFQSDQLQPHSLPPPPPPPKKTEEQQRMSLADRLRTEFGLDDPSTEAPMPPPPPPPPPPVGVAVDPLVGWSNGPNGPAGAPQQPGAAYQTRSTRRW